MLKKKAAHHPKSEEIAVQIWSDSSEAGNSYDSVVSVQPQMEF